MKNFVYNKGNFDKYNSKNLLKRTMINRFNNKLFSILDTIIKEGNSIVDVGCGEGFLTEKIAERYFNTCVLGGGILKELSTQKKLLK